MKFWNQVGVIIKKVCLKTYIHVKCACIGAKNGIENYKPSAW